MKREGGVSRATRMGEALREELSKLILFEVKDPRVSGVVVTAVRVTRDLREAWVYFVVEGGATETRLKEIDRGLAAATGFLRQKIGRVIRARSTPNLRFYFDESVERGAHMEGLLASVRKDPA